ncbi:thiamine phosphate synthase [soil metagenome]
MRERQRRLKPMPTLWLMTDERVAQDRLLRGAARLPRGSGIVLRHYRTAAAERRALFDTLRRIAVRRGLLLFLAGSEGQALAWGADGFHGREGRARRLPMSAPVHDMRELRVAERAGADVLFVSPLFATRSHPGGRVLGAFRFSALAKRAGMPVMALGGVGLRHVRLVRMLGAVGFGAIDGLSG